MQFIKLHYKAKDLTGRRFGRLIAIGPVGIYKFSTGSYVRWLCKCDCTGETVVISASLVGGHTTSCGCRLAEIKRDVWKNTRTHGAAHKIPEYGVWGRMHSRCKNPSDPSYFRYGGRGINVCDRWKDFANFSADMGLRPSSVHSIERIDNDGNYEPGNCRWATKKEQANNRRTSARITLFGRTQTLAQWAEELGMPQQIISYRVKTGKPLIGPVKKYRPRKAKLGG
jgi:hypothetical protein